MLRRIKHRPAIIHYAALTVGIFSIGMSAIFIRLANAPGVISAFFRMGIGAVLMLIPFSYQVQYKRVGFSQIGVLYAILGGFLFSLDIFFWSSGVVISGATIPTMLANTAPVWVGLGSWLVFRERRSWIFWLGLLIAVLGASLILGLDMSRAPEFGIGAWYGILAALFYGAYHLASQRGRKYLNTLSYFWISTTVSALFLLVYALILHEPFLGYDRQTWILFIVMGILVQVLGWMFINYAHGHLPAAIVSPTLLAQPLITAFFAVILLGERLTSLHLLGGGFIIGGVFLVHQSQASSSQRPNE